MTIADMALEPKHIPPYSLVNVKYGTAYNNIWSQMENNNKDLQDLALIFGTDSFLL